MGTQQIRQSCNNEPVLYYIGCKPSLVVKDQNEEDPAHKLERVLECKDWKWGEVAPATE